MSAYATADCDRIRRAVRERTNASVARAEILARSYAMPTTQRGIPSHALTGASMTELMVALAINGRFERVMRRNAPRLAQLKRTQRARDCATLLCVAALLVLAWGLA